jgi:cytochrome c
MRTKVSMTVCAVLSCSTQVHAVDTDAERAARAFQLCAACHHDRPDATGPELRTVLNRTSGSVPGFRYSNAMKRAKVVWTVENLRVFLRDPQSFVRGNRMPVSGLSDPAQIEDVLVFLRAQQP